MLGYQAEVLGQIRKRAVAQDGRRVRTLPAIANVPLEFRNLFEIDLRICVGSPFQSFEKGSALAFKGLFTLRTSSPHYTLINLKSFDCALFQQLAVVRRVLAKSQNRIGESSEGRTFANA